MLVLKGLVGLHRTVQIQLPQNYWLGHVLIYYISFSLSDLFHSVWQTLGSYTLHKWVSFVPFYSWVIFHCVYICTMLCLVTRLCLTLCDPMDYSPPGSPVHADSPGKNTGVGCHTQGIFPTQGWNPGLPHCRRILHWLSHQRSPYIYCLDTIVLQQYVSLRCTTWWCNTHRYWNMITSLRLVNTSITACTYLFCMCGENIYDLPS